MNSTQKTFSIEQIKTYQKLKKRQRQLLRWQESITEEVAKLEGQKRYQEEELIAVSKDIASKFAGLDEHEQLFAVQQRNENMSSIIGAKYITHDQKEELLERCIMEYRALHPDSQNLPFRWLKDHLASKYEINCRSVSPFFKDVWGDCEFAGGNKNRSLVLKD